MKKLKFIISMFLILTVANCFKSNINISDLLLFNFLLKQEEEQKKEMIIKTWSSVNHGKSGKNEQLIITEDNKLFLVTNKNEFRELNIDGTPAICMVFNGSYYIATEDKRLFVFGKNQYGQLGLGDTNDRNIPVEFKHKDINGKIFKVDFSKDNSVYVMTTDNKLFVVGDNQYGQLGLGDTDNRNVPVQLFKGQQVDGIWSQNYHVLASADNKLFVWGDNRYGQLGLGDKKMRDEPTEASYYKSLNYRKAHLGRYSSYLVTRDNNLYVFGKNDKGQLGLGNTDDKTQPTKINDVNIVDKVKKVRISFDSSVFIETTDNNIYVFGKNDKGQLGLGNTDDKKTPTKFQNEKLNDGITIKNIYPNLSYTLIETTDNKLFVLGGSSPETVQLPIEKKIKSISYFKKIDQSFILTEDNTLFYFSPDTSYKLVQLK